MKRKFHYTDGVGIIRIESRYRPNSMSIPKSGTWTVEEMTKGKWLMPPFPEITWATLQTLEYLGCVS